MIDCPHCQGSNEDGTAFCEHCGAEIPAQTSVSLPDPVPMFPAAPAAQAAPSAQPSQAAVSFVVARPAGESRIDFHGQELLCGRRDERMRIFPDIDLNDPAASRRHLALFLDAGKLCVQDLESGNGTVLNTTPIASGVPVELHDGDVLKIGEQITIRVEMV